MCSRSALPLCPSGLAVLALMLAWLPCAALGLDARGADILKLRLGMREQQVIEQLEAQGYVDPLTTRRRAPCAGASATSCLTSLTARTKDGSLTLTFSGQRAGEEQVTRIDYVFTARRPGEPEMIEQSVLARYGEPTTRQPMAWCDRPAGAGPCPADQPHLSFRFKPEVTLSLADGSPAGR